MDIVGQFFRDKRAAQRWMIAAIALCAVSQFFLYVNDGSVAVLNDTVNLSYVNPITVFDPGAAGTGWQLHPQAYVLLVVAAFLFLRDDFAGSRWFVRFGYWLGVALVLFSITPAAPLRGAFGAVLGLVGLLLAIIAAILHGRAVKAAAKATPPAGG
jgi:hypothetical protein